MLKPSIRQMFIRSSSRYPAVLVLLAASPIELVGRLVRLLHSSSRLNTSMPWISKPQRLASRAIPVDNAVPGSELTALELVLGWPVGSRYTVPEPDAVTRG
jgi:hypothetical protein